jgi:hypothetical protein
MWRLPGAKQDLTTAFLEEWWNGYKKRARMIASWPDALQACISGFFTG